MPSTRRQNFKARKSRKTDILSVIENLDVMLGVSENELIEQISKITTRGSNSIEYNRHRLGRPGRDNSSQEIKFQNVSVETSPNRGQGTIETNESLDILSGEINDRLSRELDIFFGQCECPDTKSYRGGYH